MKVGASIAVARRGGCSATFDQLNKYFTITGMPVASSQYWNSVHGRNQGEALQDEEAVSYTHLISEAEYKEAAQDHVYDRIQEVNRQVESDSHKYTYFTDEVIKQVENKLVSDLGYSETEAKNMVYGGGLSIYTTQDSKIQQIADQEINNPDNYSETLWDMAVSYTHLERVLWSCAVFLKKQDLQAFVWRLQLYQRT